MSEDINKRVAIEVMGWAYTRHGWQKYTDGKKDGEINYSYSWYDENGEVDLLPDYSTSIVAAWKAVEKMVKDGWEVKIEDGWSVEFTKGPWNYEIDGPTSRGYEDSASDTAPMVICLAALKAMEE